MERRAFLAGAAALLAAPLAAPLAAEVQPAGTVYRIGFLRAGEPLKFWIDEFRQGLRELGYVEGQNLIIEFKIGTLDQLPQLAEELGGRRSTSSWLRPRLRGLRRRRRQRRCRSSSPA
jgi:putative ABC transport system substrate-binding protein